MSFTIGTPSDTQAPSVPTGLGSASVSQTSCTLNWTASTDNVAVTGYDVYDGTTKLNSANITATTYAVTGLTCGTSHSMTVRAKDAAGNVSSASAALNVSTSACSGGSGGPSGYSLCSSENATCVLSGTQDVAYGANGTFNYLYGQTGSVSCSNATFGDPIPGVAKSCYVKNSTGSTSDTQAPIAPSKVAISAITQTSLTISWTASTDNVGVTGYDIYRNGSFLATATSTSYSAGGLACGTAYSFYVKAKDAAGNQSANSSTVNATTSTCPTGGGGSGNMQLGTNFWDPDWSNSTEYFVASPNFTNGSNPWNPIFLNEISIYKCLRFMDFGHTNNSNVTSWSQRTPASVNQADGSVRPNGIAYEWMIDLCNRKGADLWVCLPHKTDLNYWTQLATLIKNSLNSNLKVYVEYSNETWNGGFSQFQYTLDQGIAQGLPGGNQWYQDGAYSVWQSVKIFKAFQDVFGAAAMGSRVIRVCAASGNYDIADAAFASILSSSTWNPNSQKVDMFAIAPCVNSGDGAASNAQANFRAEIDATFTNRILTAETIANKYAMQLGCYEGGQHLLTNADVWSSNPAIYTEYIYMMNKWKPKFKLFNHYTHLGNWNSGGAWGSKQYTSSTLAESHKYRALVDWVAANPARESIEAKEVAGTSPAQLYPNLAEGKVTVSLGGAATVQLVDVQGKTLASKASAGEAIEFNLSGLAPSVYFVRIQSGSEVKTQKLFVK